MQMDTEELTGDNNRPEDVRWLYSLSESELDMLLSLKELALQRAKVIGHEDLAEKFDLKMLRGLGYILMHHVKEKVKNLPIPSLSESAALLDRCNLLKCDVEDNPGSTSNVDPATCSNTNTLKRKRAR